ncbi:MAG: winged helix-turn-helix domain-containing protein [bacterium]|nr:winged helix-turn-helix domain-containing protein [bacterium]
MIKHIIALVQSDVVQTKFRINEMLAATACHTTTDITSAYKLFEKNKIDLLIVEIPGYSNDLHDLVCYVHEISFATKILIVFLQSKTVHHEIYLNSGADLCLQQPFSKRCLELYCNKLLSVNKFKAGSLLYLGSAALQPETAHLYIGSHHQQLRKREAEILEFFFRNKNQIITRERLIDSIWGFTEEIPSYTSIDVYVRRLRMQLKNSGAILQTVRGTGYVAREVVN